MRAGGGVWHGKERSPGDVSRVQGFQLWLALLPELENGEPESRYIEAEDMRRAGPAHVIVGAYEGVSSPVPAPEGVNYLLVPLQAGQRWTYRPPAGHTVGWLALAKGVLDAGASITAGEMVLFEQNEEPIVLQASGGPQAEKEGRPAHSVRDGSCFSLGMSTRSSWRRAIPYLGHDLQQGFKDNRRPWRYRPTGYSVSNRQRPSISHFGAG
jgi:hypothetical protein